MTIVPLILAILAATTAGAGAAPSSTRAPAFPPGTEIVHFQVRNGLLYASARLLGQSGRDATGDLILDTGAPFLALREGVFDALRADTMVKLRYDLFERRRRPLASVQFGRVTLRDVPVQGLILDTLLADVLGLFAPSLFGDRGMGLDYEARTWAIIPPAVSFIGRDTGTIEGTRPEYASRVRRSRADFGRVLVPEAIGVPFRLFEGGRILVRVRAEDPAASWRSPSLTLLLDTGASCSSLFQGSAEGLTRAHRWPWLRDRRLRTAYGVIRSDHTVVPRLAFVDEGMQIDRVEMAILSRSSLDSLRTEMPEPVDGVLGANVLARFRILIDSVNQILWLTPVDESHSGHSSMVADVGLALEQRWGQMLVAAVRPGSSASRQGVAFGDVLASIEGVAMSRFEPDSAERLLEGATGSEVTVILRREGMERVLHLRRERAAAPETTRIEPPKARH